MEDSHLLRLNTIDYVTIASTGNAADFGDLSNCYEEDGCLELL